MKTIALIAASAVVVACTAQTQSRHGEVLTVETTSARCAPNDAAIRLLSNARCTHAAQCGIVGPDAPFGTLGDCKLAADLDERSAIGVDACAFGVSQSQLDKCMTAIRERPCASAMPSLADVSGCGHLVLCR